MSGCLVSELVEVADNLLSAPPGESLLAMHLRPFDVKSRVYERHMLPDPKLGSILGSFVAEVRQNVLSLQR